MMEVGLEVAKRSCKHRSVEFPTFKLPLSLWIRLVRFRMAIYVPGLVWHGDQWADFALSKDFDLEHLVRLIIKLLHICTSARITRVTSTCTKSACHFAETITCPLWSSRPRFCILQAPARKQSQSAPSPLFTTRSSKLRAYEQIRTRESCARANCRQGINIRNMASIRHE